MALVVTLLVVLFLLVLALGSFTGARLVFAFTVMGLLFGVIVGKGTGNATAGLLSGGIVWLAGLVLDSIARTLAEVRSVRRVERRRREHAARRRAAAHGERRPPNRRRAA